MQVNLAAGEARHWIETRFEDLSAEFGTMMAREADGLSVDVYPASPAPPGAGPP
jgi:hypothetical protein